MQALAAMGDALGFSDIEGLAPYEFLLDQAGVQQLKDLTAKVLSTVKTAGSAGAERAKQAPVSSGAKSSSDKAEGDNIVAEVMALFS